MLEVLMIIVLAPLALMLGFGVLTLIGGGVTNLMESKAPWVVLMGLLLLSVFFIR